jgi:hypothetical protein
MPIYTIEIITRFEIETDDIDDVRLNYDTPTLEYCKSIVGEPEFLSGGFLFEEEQRIKTCDRCGYSPCAGDAISPTCTEENYMAVKEGKN